MYNVYVMIKFLQKWFSPKLFMIEHPSWSHEDKDDMRLFTESHHYSIVKKGLQKRLNSLTERLVNGEDTRSRIDEVSDILLEYKNYETA